MLLNKNGKNEFLLPVIFLCLIVFLWQVLVPTIGIPGYLFPTPYEIMEKTVEKAPLIYENAWPTLIEFLLGFFLAVFFGVLAAIIITHSKLVDKILMPILIVSQTVPVIALAPLLAIWFGMGIAPKILIAFIFAFFPITVNTVKGFNSVDERFFDMMKVIGAKKTQFLLKIQFPTAQPYIFAALKLAITYSLIGAIVGELVASNEGLGYLLIKSLNRLDTAMAFSVIVIVSLLGVGLYKSVELIEARISSKVLKNSKF